MGYIGTKPSAQAISIGADTVLSSQIADGAILNTDINSSAAINATKIADGTVTSAEFQFINTLSSNAQSQIDGILDGATFTGGIGGTTATFSSTLGVTGHTTAGNIYSNQNNTYDLGTNSNYWKNCYLYTIDANTITANGAITTTAGISGATGTFSDDVTLSSTSPQLHLTNTGTSASQWVSFNTSAGRTGFVGQGGSGTQIVLQAESGNELLLKSGGANAVTFSTTQNADFAGDIYTSGDNIRMTRQATTGVSRLWMTTAAGEDSGAWILGMNLGGGDNVNPDFKIMRWTSSDTVAMTIAHDLSTTFAGNVTVGASKKLYMNNTTTDLMMDTNQIGIDSAGKNLYIHGFNGSNGNVSLGKADTGTITCENLLSVVGDIVGATDSYTKLLIHSDTSDGSTTFTDSSSSGHALTQNGASHEDTQQKFGATSIQFDGDSDYITLPSSTDWTFGTGDFTLDYWVYVNVALDQNLTIMDQWPTANAFQLWLEADLDMVLYYRDGGSSVSLIPYQSKLVLNTWTHIAIVRHNDIITLYVDGIASTTTYDASGKDFGAETTAIVGTQKNSLTYSIYGSMDEIRISKGIARWTSNFTPPQASYSNKVSTFQGAIEPSVDKGDSLGSASKRWGNIYTSDLHLANERGDWTVIEESEYLTISNNKSGKRYKLLMEEI